MMKCNPTTTFFLLLCLTANTLISKAQSLQISDTLNVQWTRQEGPSAFVSKYGESNGTLFAASEEALFSSTDGGAHWEYNQALGRKRIKRFFANDHALIVIVEEPEVIDPGNTFSIIDLHHVLHSKDGGLSWNEVLSFYQEPESYYPNQTYEIFEANDSTLIFNYLYYPTLVYAGNLNTWISSNYGSNWTQPINNAGLLHAIQDTVSFVKSGTTAVEFGGIARITDLSNPQTVNLTPTNSTWANLKKVFYQDGVFYLFQQNKTLWRSADLGAVWTEDLLPVSGDFKDVIWTKDAFYVLTTQGVFRANQLNPTAFTPIYTGQQAIIKEAKTFTPLSTGYWLNNNLNQTLFSADDGQTWEAKSKGLSSNIGQITSICDQLFARSVGAGSTKGGWYLSDNQDQNWSLQTDQAFYQNDYLEAYLGEIDGLAYRYKPPVMQQSLDCGQTWTNLNLSVTAQPKGIIKHQNRLLLYTSLDVVLLYSDDQGTTWNSGTLPDYSVIKLISMDNNLLAFYNHTSYISTDLGASWQERPHPMGTENMLFSDQKLLTHDKFSHFDTTHVFESTDAGLNWSILIAIPPTVRGKSDLIYYDSNILLLHHDLALFVSNNGGETWALIQGSPFTKREIYYDANWVFWDTLVPQASRYLIDKGKLYAATEADGIWSTPVDALLQNPTTTFTDLTSPAQKQFQIQPNPANTEIWVIAPETLDASGRVQLLDASGRVWRTWEHIPFSKTGAKLAVENLPKGLYFVQIMSLGRVETHRLLIF